MVTSQCELSGCIVKCELTCWILSCESSECIVKGELSVVNQPLRRLWQFTPSNSPHSSYSGWLWLSRIFSANRLSINQEPSRFPQLFSSQSISIQNLINIMSNLIDQSSNDRNPIGTSRATSHSNFLLNLLNFNNYLLYVNHLLNFNTYWSLNE